MLRAWTQASEQHTATDEPVERPRTTETTNTQRLHDEPEQRNKTILPEADRVQALTDELAQASYELQSVKGACSLLERERGALQQNLNLSQRDIEVKDELIAAKDKVIADKEKELHGLKEEIMDLTSGADAPFEEHHTESITTDYNQLMQQYKHLETKSNMEREALEVDKAKLHGQLKREQNALRDAIKQQTSVLQDEVDSLREEVGSLQTQAHQSESSHAEALKENSMRMCELERQQTKYANNLIATEESLNHAIRLRHRTTDFPLIRRDPRTFDSRFESDVRFMIDHRINENLSTEYLGIWEIVYDEEKLGFRSRLFRIRNELGHIKNFIDWLKELSSEPLVLDFCIEHEEGRMQFQRILEIGQGPSATDADAKALIAYSARNAQLFYGLPRDDFDLFRRKYRGAGGLSTYNKRKHDRIEKAPSGEDLGLQIKRKLLSRVDTLEEAAVSS